MNPLEQVVNRNQILKQDLEFFIEFYDGAQMLEIAALADKIEHMVRHIGSPSSVIPMLKAIIKGKVNHWGTYDGVDSRYNKRGKRGYCPEKITGMHITQRERQYENIMKGHFRWNFDAYMLDRYTRDYINDYFFKRTVTEPRRSENGFRLRMVSVHPWKNSDNQYIVDVKTVKDNDYKFFYYVDKDMMISNLVGDVTPTEREYFLKVIENKFGKVRK